MCEGHDEWQELVDKFTDLATRSRDKAARQSERQRDNVLESITEEKPQSIDDCCRTEDICEVVQGNYNPLAEQPLVYDTAPEQAPLYVVPVVIGISYSTQKSFDESYRDIQEPHTNESHFHGLYLS